MSLPIHEHMAQENRELRAEIERLRALILDACDVLEHYDLAEHAFHYRRELGEKEFDAMFGADAANYIRQLQAEIERLRAALQDIASDICSRSGQVDIARRALEGKE
jgi:uncharacterized small protein (DUF1192 family)